MTTTPTLEQIARATDLVTKIAEIAGLEHDLDEGGVGLLRVHAPPHGWLTWHNILDPRAFQAVLLGLPFVYVSTIWRELCPVSQPGKLADGDFEGHLLQWILTPAGMLRVYEEIVRAWEDDQ